LSGIPGSGNTICSPPVILKLYWRLLNTRENRARIRCYRSITEAVSKQWSLNCLLLLQIPRPFSQYFWRGVQGYYQLIFPFFSIAFS
jgi:hypothetical protein